MRFRQPLAAAGTPLQPAEWRRFQPPSGGAPTLSLRPPVPNPGRSALPLDFSLPRAGAARLEILDVAGRMLWSRQLADVGAGEHRVLWDGRSLPDGQRVVGLCFIRLRTASGVVTTRAVRLP